MKIQEIPLSGIRPYERNPRRNDDAVQYVANSIREFGFKVPIVIDGDGVIVAGHTRFKAAQQLGLETVPCVIADDLTPDQIKAFRLADNKTAEMAGWDFELLDLELEDIDLDMSAFGFEFLDDYEPDKEFEETENIYTSKTDIPQYMPSGENVGLSECLDKEKYETLINHIKQSSVSDDEKYFLCMAAARHLCFNYKKVADYYAGKANKEMQELMEESALVLIDYGDAIKNGYAVLRKTVTELLDNE